MMRSSAFALILTLGISACATVASFTLQDRFRAIGLPPEIADCMVGELEQSLSSEDLQDLARYTIGLARADSTFGAVRSLMQIENPRAVRAVGSSAVSCVTGFRL